MIEIPDGATAWPIPFTIHDPISGDACNADSTLYVLALDLDSAGPLPPSYFVTPIITAVVGGVTQKAPLESFRAGAMALWGAVVADGSNTATTFKVSGNFDDTTDSLKEALLVFITGDHKSQMRPASAYDATTDFVTVGQGGFPSAPTAGDRFLVVFK